MHILGRNRSCVSSFILLPESETVVAGSALSTCQKKPRKRKQIAANVRSCTGEAFLLQEQEHPRLPLMSREDLAVKLLQRLMVIFMATDLS